MDGWSNFDWDSDYEFFLEEFSSYFRTDGLEPTRTREMASRCIVEMATASFYTMLSRISPDPVLATIARWIAEDEIRHYKHFYRYFCRYQQIEPESRTAVGCALLHRLQMINGEDIIIAVKHLYSARHPGGLFRNSTYRNLRRRPRSIAQPEFPHRMCVQMLLKPLGLGPRAHRIALPIAETIARRIV